jgi:hypothetical protein
MRGISENTKWACSLIWTCATATLGCGQSLEGSTPTAPSNELWWSYLADYEGKPGSVTLDLGLKHRIPNRDYPFLLVAGVTYPSNEFLKGLPEAAQLDTLYEIGDASVAFVSKMTTAIHAGSFTHGSERLEYVYVSDSIGLRPAMNAFYEEHFPGRSHYVNVQNDPEWAGYLAFLYPNAATIAHYRKDLARIGVIDP